MTLCKIMGRYDFEDIISSLLYSNFLGIYELMRLASSSAKKKKKVYHLTRPCSIIVKTHQEINILSKYIRNIFFVYEGNNFLFTSRVADKEKILKLSISNISFDKPYDIFNGFGSLKSLVIKSELFDASDTRNRAFQAICDNTNLTALTMAIDTRRMPNTKPVKLSTTLTSLNLHNPNPFIKNSIIHCTLLRTLTINNNENQVTNEAIHALSHLERLQLEDNKIITGASIDGLTALSHLTLISDSGFTNGDAKYLTKLQKLELTESFTFGNNGLSTLTQLTSLYFYHLKSIHKE